MAQLHSFSSPGFLRELMKTHITDASPIAMIERGLSEFPTGRSEAPGILDAVAAVADYIALMKPRVVSLGVFTAFVGFVIAPGTPEPLMGLAAIALIGLGASAGGVLNMWYDADIDGLMKRTARRPSPRGRISRNSALAFGVALAALSVTGLGLVANWIAASVLAFAIFFYAVIYTVLLKRRTPQNVVVGGAAGAFPPAIGWLCAGGHLTIAPLLLFGIIFLWTPPHFWSLALNRVDEYRRAGIPMLPVVTGRTSTARHILVYTILLAAATEIPWLLGFASNYYGVIVAILGARFALLALRLYKEPEMGKGLARKLFTFSILYLFALFAAVWLDVAITHHSL